VMALGKGFSERFEKRGVDAVVVSNENLHTLSGLKFGLKKRPERFALAFEINWNPMRGLFCAFRSLFLFFCFVFGWSFS
jgi:hypothetical protein